MLNAIDNYFLKQEEPVKSCLLFLRAYILKQDENITEALKYGMPFFVYNGKMFCYLWIHKKYGQPYIGFVEGDTLDHPDLLKEKRARMKIFLIDAEKDIPVRTLDTLFKKYLRVYMERG